MNASHFEQGDREVRPGQKRGSAGRGAKARRAEKRASQRLAAARRLVERIESTTRERHEAWAEGDLPFRTERLTEDLEALHSDKREMRREVYRVAPELEGQPVFRHTPGGRR